jgi:hypothetical protein
MTSEETGSSDTGTVFLTRVFPAFGSLRFTTPQGMWCAMCGKPTSPNEITAEDAAMTILLHLIVSGAAPLSLIVRQNV